LEIFGHTDNVGNAQTNLSLSQQRADAVADYLVRRGIPKERIFARGFGERYPLASNNTPEGRMENRRVEIHLFLPVP
jgi:outer membrane protein OmpA-like peptidoglycan-associated protein